MHINILNVFSVLLIANLVTGCAGLPADNHKTWSEYFRDSKSTRLARLVHDHAQSHKGRSGFLVLDSGKDAYLKRLDLIDTAEQSIDAQYYIWRSDKTGKQLAARLVDAADRGVRVRLLLDDYGSGGKDNALFALDAYPNIEVRIYNPFERGFRSGLRRTFNLLGDFARLNRRNHNKTFIVDGSFAIVGGRNIGDEYFDAREDMNHRDRELLAVGTVLEDLASHYDLFWNSDWAVPINSVVSAGLSHEDIQARYAVLQDYITNPANQPFAADMAVPTRSGRMDSWMEQMVWAPAEFVYNSLEMTAGNENPEMTVAAHLLALAEQSQSEILIESAYFTLLDAGIDALGERIDRGVKIRVLTNSLAATDVWTIHSGYTRNRKKIIRRGIDLHEFMVSAEYCRDLVQNETLDCADFRFSLHAKSVVFDRNKVFVGSFNLNPRSSFLNTETALIVHSEKLAERIAGDIEQGMRPENSWHVVINNQGALEWKGRQDNEDVVNTHEPDVSGWMRFKSFIFSFLPVEKYW